MTGERPPAATGPTVSFGFNLAKVPDHGEDSDPILRDGPDLGLAAVFDGMGGAGGTVYDTEGGARSGAWIASRIARIVVEGHLLGVLTPDAPLPGAATATALHDVLEQALQAELESLHAPASGLRSRLLRALPTTMALGALRREGDAWVCDVLWAGDSRVYAVTPQGMHQLSVDDLRDDGDAMENLRRDSVIGNAISADTAFRINHRRVTLDAPLLLVCATDGCFGYLRSPMHFEALVLQAMAGAETEQEWSAVLQSRIAAVTGDDASLAVIGVGAGLAELQRLYAPRLAEVVEQYTAPVDELRARVVEAERALTGLQRRSAEDLDARWRRYRDGYEQYLRGDAEIEPAVPERTPEQPIWNPEKPIDTGAPVPAAAPEQPVAAVGAAPAVEDAR